MVYAIPVSIAATFAGTSLALGNVVRCGIRCSSARCAMAFNAQNEELFGDDCYIALSARDLIVLWELTVR